MRRETWTSRTVEHSQAEHGSQYPTNGNVDVALIDGPSSHLHTCTYRPNDECVLSEQWSSSDTAH